MQKQTNKYFLQHRKPFCKYKITNVLLLYSSKPSLCTHISSSNVLLTVSSHLCNISLYTGRLETVINNVKWENSQQRICTSMFMRGLLKWTYDQKTRTLWGQLECVIKANTIILSNKSSVLNLVVCIYIPPHLKWSFREKKSEFYWNHCCYPYTFILQSQLKWAEAKPVNGFLQKVDGFYMRRTTLDFGWNSQQSNRRQGKIGNRFVKIRHKYLFSVTTSEPTILNKISCKKIWKFALFKCRSFLI